jgi:hypothetical protein
MDLKTNYEQNPVTILGYWLPSSLEEARSFFENAKSYKNLSIVNDYPINLNNFNNPILIALQVTPLDHSYIVTRMPFNEKFTFVQSITRCVNPASISPIFGLILQTVRREKAEYPEALYPVSPEDTFNAAPQQPSQLQNSLFLLKRRRRG